MMPENYWETIYAESPFGSVERLDESAVFDWIERTFPVLGTKIDWRRVQGSHVEWHFDDDAQLASMAAEQVRRRITSDSTVEHVGDGLSPYGIRFGESNADSILAALLEIPEHHYFVAADRSWLVAVTTEGYLDVWTT